MATQPQDIFTFGEYLDHERRADHKSEFHAGAIYAMSGGTFRHSALSARITALFASKLSNCWTFDSNLKLYVEQFGKGVYPDAMVVCGEPEFWDRQQDVIVNPSVVVEVLSPSTKSYDQGSKSSYYRSIPSLRDILIVSRDRVFVEHSTSTGNQSWQVTQRTSRSDLISVLNTEIQVGEIYSGILE